MDIQQYLAQKKKLQNSLCRFIEDENKIEENYQNLIQLIEGQNICQNSAEIQSFLSLLLNISNNFNRSSDFFSKIEKLILYIKTGIQTHLTNYQLFNILKANKRILLFLFKKKLLKPEKLIIFTFQQKKFKKFNYFSFLHQEIKKTEQTKEEKEHERKATIGENDDIISEMIRNDSIEEFITFSKKKKFQLKSTIEQSIYETNYFLLKNKPTLIEYAAFFGSMQIFRYLNLNGIELKPPIWIYSIHGRNPEMISYLEDKKVVPEDCSFKECLKETIKCHHNEMTNYIHSNFCQNVSIENDHDLIKSSIKYYNYEFFPTDLNNEFVFFQLCRYNYIYFVDLILKEKKIDVNKKIDEKTPLMIAAKKENIDIVNLLINVDNIEIDNGTFKGCVSLKNISIPSSIKKIPDNAFNGCVSLTEIKIPNSLTSICKNAFKGCTSLNQIAIPSCINEIGECAFKGCSSLTSILIILNEKDKNESDSFEYNIKRKTSIGNSAFKGCSLLKICSISSSLLSIGKSSFDSCSSLNELKIASNIVTIKESSFKGCSLLKKVCIHSSEIEIGSFAFNDCPLITEINLHFFVINIGNNAFEDCKSLTKITADTNDAIDDNNSSLIDIPSSVKSIGNNAFEDCSSIENISIPSSLVSIGSFAFKGCSKLQEMNIPSSVKDIGDNAFYQCSELKKVTISSSLTKIRTFSFRDCFSLTFISIPSSVTEIGYAAFYSCSSLKKVLIPSSVTEIGYYAFYGCSSLVDVKIPSSVASIGGSCFECCTSLKRIVIPPSVVSIGEKVLKDCPSLLHIEMPKRVEQVSDLGVDYKVDVIKL